MLQRLLFVFVAAIACADFAKAQDPYADFSGVYLGLDLGYGFGAGGDWCYCTFLTTATDAAGGEGGVTVAAETGYAMRLGSIVVEAAARAGHSDIAFSEVCTGGLSCAGKLSWLAEGQVSAGIVLFDHLLVAGTLAYVAADVQAQTGAAAATTALHEGHAYAGRIERAMPGGWRMGLEYRRYDMEGTNSAPSGDVDINWSAETIALLIHYELSP